MAKLAIVLGSKSDQPFFEQPVKLLAALGIEANLHILSAHRSPNKTAEFAKSAESEGMELIIAAAGGAAHLPGVIAAHTNLPVIGVPIPGSLGGMDALLSMVQMPKGVPVATLAIGEAGALNAAMLAGQILGIKYPEIRQKMARIKLKMEEDTAFNLASVLQAL